MLNVQVECTLLIPGGAVDTVVEAQVCAAETLLVGRCQIPIWSCPEVCKNP